MLTVSEDERDLAAALRGGARGYLLKTVDSDVLAARHRARDARRVDHQPRDDRQAGRRPSRRCQRRADAAGDAGRPTPTRSTACRRASRRSCAQIARGASNKEIARTLDIAETTVKIHVQHILRKLNLSSRVQAAVLAAERGLAG